MVRHKTRWILLRVDYQQHIYSNDHLEMISRRLIRKNRKARGGGGSGASNPSAIQSYHESMFPNRKDLAYALRDHLLAVFGDVAAGMAFELQGTLLTFFVGDQYAVPPFHGAS